MSYKNCPQCGSSNRAGDVTCYSCQAEMSSTADEAAPPPVAPLIGQQQLAAAGGVVTARNMDRKSNWKQGLRAGLKAGLFTGVFWGLYGAFFGSAIAGISVGFGVFILLLLENVFYCTLMGVIIGAMDMLCFRYDAAKIGSVFGLLYALQSLSPVNIFYGGAYGGLMGALCSHLEKGRRGQYSEWM